MVLHIILWSRIRRYLFPTRHHFYGWLQEGASTLYLWDWLTTIILNTGGVNEFWFRVKSLFGQQTLKKNFKCELSNVPNRTPSALTNNHIHEQCISKDMLFWLIEKKCTYSTHKQLGWQCMRLWKSSDHLSVIIFKCSVLRKAECWVKTTVQKSGLHVASVGKRRVKHNDET